MSIGLKIRIFETPEDLGRAAAGLILEEYGQKGKLILGVPWGSTPIPILNAFADIVKKQNVSLANFHMVMMDEYVVKENNSYSYVDGKAAYSGRYHVNRDILRKLPSLQSAELAKNIHFPNPNNPEGFDKLIEGLGGVDIFIVATGAHDGHVAQNGPGTPIDFGTRVLSLSRTVIEYNFEKMQEEFGNDIENVPKFGVSIGLSTILKSRELLFVAFGSSKREITQRLFWAKKFDINWPVTFLWEAIDKTEFYIDKAAAEAK